MTPRLRSLLAVLSLAGSLVVVVGCNDSAQPAQPEPSAEAAQPVAQPPQENEVKKDQDRPGKHPGRHHGPGMHHGGPLGLLKAALRELDLSAEQKAAVEGALAKLPAPPHERGEGPGKEARAALARSVREGKVDPGAIPAAPRPDFEAMQASAAEALQTLHRTLTPEQRRALVDALQMRAEEHGPWGRGKGGPEGEGPREHGKHGPRGAGRDGLGPAGFFLRDLGLTELQKASIQKALRESMADHAGDKGRPDPAALEKKREEMRAERKARLESFVGENFDARAFVAPPKDAKEHPGLKEHGARMHRMLAVVVPLLDSAQREKLAQRIESGPAFPPPGHHGPDAPEGE